MPKLTALAVRNLVAPGKYADGDGLFLHVLDNTRHRYWRYRFQRHGRERVMSFGSADDITLADARRLHAKARAVVLAGGDPLDQRKQAKQQRRQQAHTFAEAADAYIAAHSPAWKDPATERKWRQCLRDYVLPKIGRSHHSLGFVPPPVEPQPPPPAPPTEHELRAQLAAALDTQRAADETLQRAKAAYERAEQHRQKCQMRLVEFSSLDAEISATTTAALREGSDPEDVHETFAGRLAERASIMAEAHAAETAAATLMREMTEALQKADAAARAVDVAAVRVLGIAVADKLGEECRQLQGEITRRRAVLLGSTR